MKYCQLVMGSAGTGKSTYCHTMQEHCATKGRTLRVANLDPAAEHFKYAVAFDIRELVSVEDVMAELQLGPNGALVWCMEYLLEDDSQWLQEKLEEYMEDDYLLIDCPGQIELYSHIPVFKRVAALLQVRCWRVAEGRRARCGWARRRAQLLIALRSYAASLRCALPDP